MAEQVDALSHADVAELANFIIRPPLVTYNLVELGGERFTCEKVECIRHDVELDTTRGLTIMKSHFRPLRAPDDLPTVVYMHGNGSCRVEGIMLLHFAVPYGLALFSFDFTGSGMSGGEYISLGVYEKYEVEAVVDHLVEDRGVKRIVLWGHSMGAATAVMYSGLCKRRPEVKGLVLDSPFASFEKPAQSMVSEMPLPIAVPRKLILSVGVRAVRKVVGAKAAVDVMDIDPLSAAKRINYELPASFLHGTADAVVPLNHGELLHKHFPCSEKQLITLRTSEHDSPRPEWAMDKVHIFLQKHLREYGVSDLQFLEQIKARGNAAMLAGRFRDTNVLYTEALNALSENAVAVKLQTLWVNLYRIDSRIRRKATRGIKSLLKRTRPSPISSILSRDGEEMDNHAVAKRLCPCDLGFRRAFIQISRMIPSLQGRYPRTSWLCHRRSLA